MDSINIAWWKRPEVAIFVDYGQKPAPAERDAGLAACRAMNIRYEQIKADCSALGSGDMAGMAPSPHAPVSEWWPFPVCSVASHLYLNQVRAKQKQDFP